MLEQEVRQKVIDEYKLQADQYMTNQIALRHSELQLVFEDEVMKETNLRASQQSEGQSFEFDMDGDPQNAEKQQNGIAGNLERSQIRRRNAKAGKLINTIGNNSEMCDSDVRSEFSAMQLKH